MKKINRCMICDKETYNPEMCRECYEKRKNDDPRNYCQCGRGKWFDAPCCEVCWNSGY